LSSRAPALTVVATAVVSGSVGFACQPDASSLTTFFSTIAQVSVTLLVAVALFAGAVGDPGEYRQRRWLSPYTFVYLGLSTAAGIIGATGAVRGVACRTAFAASIAGSLAGLLTVLAMGWENWSYRNSEGAAARAAVLDPDPPLDAGRESSP
jgi:hypothetical protein